jgi:uridine phosphorylase
MLPDTNTAIIEPQKGKREEALPPSCVLVFSPQDLSRFARSLSQLHKLPHKIFLAELSIGLYDDASIALVGPTLGAPQTVLILEKLIALGVRNIVAVGWCGSLQPHVQIGDLVLPTGAVSEEGTSKHYPISEQHPGPSVQLLSSLRSEIGKVPLNPHEGPVWSTDAPYRETVGKVLDYQKQGVLAVEMESSALFTVAHFRGIRLAMVLAVSDELATLQWRHGFRDARFQRVREILPDLVLASLGAMEQ